MSTMDNFYSTVKPFCVLSKCLGFFPLSIEVEDEATKIGNTEGKICNLLITFLTVLVFIFIIIANIVHYKTFMNETDFFEFIIWSWLLIFMLPTVLLAFIIQMCKLGEIKELFELMNRSDMKLKKLQMHIDNKRQRKFVTILTILTLLIPSVNYSQMILVNVNYSTMEFHTLVHECFFSFFLLFECFLSCQFIIPTFLVRERFKTLQDYLRFKIIL